MNASIVIPTKNGGSRFSDVIRAIKAQKTTYEYEVIVVDSGSTDNTVSLAKDAGFKVYEIEPKDFGHGKTRNYGASLGRGEYIIFLTQDATPADDKWLDAMLSAMYANPDAAGAFGRHLPYEDCNLPDQQMLENHFNRFLDAGDKVSESVIVYYLDDRSRERFETDKDFEQLYAFFSDNNSCLKRSVWEEIPYEDVDFAEDQIWAKAILEKGLKKLYVDDARVKHSHDYPLKEYGKRYFDDFKALYSTYEASYCKGGFDYWHKVLGDTKYNVGYIRRREDLSFLDKLKWSIYSFKRNKLRYKAAIDAVEYFSFDEEKKKLMDIKYSQAYENRG